MQTGSGAILLAVSYMNLFCIHVTKNTSQCRYNNGGGVVWWEDYRCPVLQLGATRITQGASVNKHNKFKLMGMSRVVVTYDSGI